MRKHLITYCKENHGLLQVLLCEQLTKSNLTLDQYMCLMEGTPTCGYEITLLLLSQMFNIAILVICSDFLWVSTQVPPRECPVVIIQNTSGEFLGTKSTSGVQPVSVGTVRKISVNKKRSPILVKSLIPDDYSRKDVAAFDKMLNEKLSPIAEKDDNFECRSVDSEFDESVDLLATANKDECTEDNVKCDSVANSNDVVKAQVHLNIKDIGNDTSVESVLNIAQLVTNTTNNDLATKTKNNKVSDKLVCDGNVGDKSDR